MTIKKQIQQDEASSVKLHILFFTVKRFFSSCDSHFHWSQMTYLIDKFLASIICVMWFSNQLLCKGNINVDSNILRQCYFIMPTVVTSKNQMQVIFAPTRIAIKRLDASMWEITLSTQEVSVSCWGQSLGVLMSYILLHWSDQYKQHYIYLHIIHYNL